MTAVTPLSSQAPQVFRPLGGVRANSTSGVTADTHTNPLLPQFSTTRDDSSSQNQTPAQLAAAAAMRRLAKMAKDQRPMARESSGSEPSFFSAPVKPKTPYLVPAYNDRQTSAISFSVSMPAFPATGPTRAGSNTEAVEAARQTVDERITNLKRQVAELQASLAKDEDNTPARLEELYKLHELVGNLANRSTMAFSASVGGPSVSDGPSLGPATRSPSQSPPLDEMSPITSEHDEIDQDHVDPDVDVGRDARF